MAHQVNWNRRILEEFIKEGMMTEFEENVLRTRVEKGMTIVEQACVLHGSVSKVNRAIDRLKQKYDSVAAYDPILPPRASLKTGERITDFEE